MEVQRKSLTSSHTKRANMLLQQLHTSCFVSQQVQVFHVTSTTSMISPSFQETFNPADPLPPQSWYSLQYCYSILHSYYSCLHEFSTSISFLQHTIRMSCAPITTHRNIDSQGSAHSFSGSRDIVSKLGNFRNPESCFL